MSTKLKAGTATSGAVIDADTTGILELQSGSTPTTAITVDATQNVGIGTSSPASSLDVQAVDGRSIIRLTATTNTNPVYSRASNAGGFLYLGRDGSAGSDFGAGAYSAGIWSTGAYPMVFGTNGTERMRIDSSGNLLVGTTTSPASSGGKLACSGGTYFSYGSNNAGGTNFVVYNSSNVGVYLVAGQTSWTANSDERLKDISGNLENSLNAVNSLRAIKYTLKSDEDKVNRVGLVAQDVQKVLPEVVDTNENGFLGVRYSEIVPLLVSAIQELNAKVDAQAAEIATLKGAA